MVYLLGSGDDKLYVPESDECWHVQIPVSEPAIVRVIDTVSAVSFITKPTVGEQTAGEKLSEGSQNPTVELEGSAIDTVVTIEFTEQTRVHGSFSQGTFAGVRLICAKNIKRTINIA